MKRYKSGKSRFSFNSRPLPARRDINLVPLIDIIFMLLIFFIMAGRVDSPETLKIAAPLAMLTNKHPSDSAVIYLSREGTVAFNETVVKKERLKSMVAAVLAASGGKAEITLKADRALPAQELVWVMHAVEAAGGKELILATEALE